MKLTKYFLEFENNEIWNGGFGVTAWNDDDALIQIKKAPFKDEALPELMLKYF